MDIDNKNDRSILILLQRKKDKTEKDEKIIRALELRYPDYKRYESRLIKELTEVEFLKKTDLTPELPSIDENGDPNVNKRFSEPITTSAGLTALSNGFFVSESEQEAREKRRWRLDGWVKWCAIVLGIINFLWLLITQLKC